MRCVAFKPALWAVAAAVLWHAVMAHAAPPVAAVRARLIKTLDSHSLQPGSTFYLSTMVPWKSGNCAVRANTMLTGHVAVLKLRKDGAKKDEVGISFEPVSCYQSETVQAKPVLAAMRGPAASRDQNGLQTEEMKQAMMSMIGAHSPATLGGPGSVKGAGSAPAINSDNRQTSAYGYDYQTVNDDELRTGQVKDIGGVRMTLPPPGSDVTSLLASHNIVLNPGTQFMIVFVGLPGSVSKPELAKASGPQPPASETMALPAIPPVDGGISAVEAAIEEAQQCGEGCAQIENTAAIATGQAGWSLSLAGMGLRPRKEQTRVALDDDASVNFLGEDQILITMNPHALTRRSTSAASHPRSIRAVLLSRDSGHILMTQDWLVPEGFQYIWSFGDGRLLAHIGRELVLLGPGLIVERRFTLPGPLLFADITPAKSSEGVLAVTTIHEKHGAGDHERFAASLGPDWPIEEDYDVTMLNSQLQPNGSRSLDVKPASVAMIDSGMITLRHDRGQNWKVQLEDWLGKNETIAHLQSGCEVQLTSMPGNLLFATLCSADRHGVSFWVMNEHGRLLLQGHSASTSFIQQARSNARGDVVAIAATESDDPLDLAVGARVADFRRLNVSVYRVADGKRIFAARPPEGSALRQTFSLSPSGDGLAVLSGSTLQAYELGSSRPHAVAATTIAPIPAN